MRVGIIGGTGWQGAGVAARLVYAGNTVLVGSRHISRSRHIATQLPRALGLPAEQFIPVTNQQAAQEGEWVFVTLPITAHRTVLAELRDYLQGKLVVDVTAPVNPYNQIENLWPCEGSALQEAEAVLGEGVTVVGALKNISASALLNLNKPVNGDVFVMGRDLGARHKVAGLLRQMGLNPYDVGYGDVCRTVEGLTSLLIYLNYAYHLQQPGIKVQPMEPGIEFIPDETLLPPK
ncbi:MAG: NAD(P)-binding domain-containing protein [bacterium]